MHKFKITKRDMMVIVSTAIVITSMVSGTLIYLKSTKKIKAKAETQPSTYQTFKASSSSKHSNSNKQSKSSTTQTTEPSLSQTTITSVTQEKNVEPNGYAVRGNTVGEPEYTYIYTAVGGETLLSVCDRFNASYAGAEAVNNVPLDTVLKPGQTIKLW